VEHPIVAPASFAIVFVVAHAVGGGSPSVCAAIQSAT
jgi:hypothetical protein